jgi:hypothetical protein
MLIIHPLPAGAGELDAPNLYWTTLRLQALRRAPVVSIQRARAGRVAAYKKHRAS